MEETLPLVRKNTFGEKIHTNETEKTTWCVCETLMPMQLPNFEKCDLNFTLTLTDNLEL